MLQIGKGGINIFFGYLYLADLADTPNGSIRIGELRTQAILF